MRISFDMGLIFKKGIHPQKIHPAKIDGGCEK
jgi:hypothetical protein